MLLRDDQLWHVHHGDAITHMPEMPEKSVDFSVFSPPFPKIFAYTSEHSDLGNTESEPEIRLHFGFFFSALARVMKPGRVVMVHCMQIPRMKRTGEGRGTHDFRGLIIRIGERAGFDYDYDWAVRKNPQAQAIRTKSRSLQFTGLESDRAQSRGSLPDYLIKFFAPGENKVPITDIECEEDDTVRALHPRQVSRNDWIEWAEGTWKVNESDTLNKGPKHEGDVLHICPLQLPIVNRLVRLYSNPGETVFSPFTGIGTEGYESLRLGRKFYGCELKKEYHAMAQENLAKAVLLHKADQRTLFDDIVPQEEVVA